MRQTKTLGIVAHVDAGKTSLTEELLHLAGTTRTKGSVDKGSAVTDGLAMEKARGISIKTASVELEWNGHCIQLVDTPGHIDFSAEVDRALDILDVVILVVSAVEGVQANTLNLWEALKERGIPVIVFVNKIDRLGADLERVFKDIERDLQLRACMLNYLNTHNEDAFTLTEFHDFGKLAGEYPIEKTLENIADYDDAILESLLAEDLLNYHDVYDTAKILIKDAKLVPVVVGSAKMSLGISELLVFIQALFPYPNYSDQTLSAKVFKVYFDERFGRLAHVKVLGGTLRAKASIWSQTAAKDCKINQLLKRKLNSYEPVAELHAGDIGVIATSEAIPAGDVLGTQTTLNTFTPMNTPVLSTEVKAVDEKEYQNLGQALEYLNIEDPLLDFSWNKEERTFSLKILGPMQTEILKDSLLERHGIATEFFPPKVIYKETPKTTAEGYVRYWMPKPSWAIMTFLIEPGTPGSGVQYRSAVRTSDIATKYQNEVERAIPWSLRQGIKGWEVTDLSITLQEGSDHNVHSNPGDFLLATPMGILRGLEQAGTDLLEPMYRFQIKAPSESIGAITGDLSQMGAQLETPEFIEDSFLLSGRVAVAQALEYPIRFAGTTSGKGRLKFTLDGYDKTEFSEDKTRPYQGVCPLDEAQWILHKRGAFKADERKNW